MPAHSSTVALVRAGDYHQSRQAVERALRLLELGPDFFRGKRVALKVNMMKGAAPERALATHPEFVRALARIVRDAGGSPFVCDSSGILGFTAEAFEAAGYTAMCAEEGIELVDLDAEPPVWRSIRGRRLPGVWMGKAALEADLLVTVPKLKTHTITKLTCALKNHMGLLVGATKCRLHEMAPRPGQLAEALVDLHLARRVDLAVVDGILGLDGGGTVKRRTPRRSGLVIAGRDPVAVDAVAADAIGLQPGSVALTTAAARRGLGTADLGRITVLGEDLQSSRCEYEPAGFELKRFAPAAWFVYRTRGRSLAPTVLDEACTGCGDCAAACPVEAILVEGTARIDLHTCIRCYACRFHCPEGALKLKCKPLLKKTFRRKAEGLPLRDMI